MCNNEHKPIARDRRDAFFSCQNQNIKQVERSLVTAGVPITSRGDDWLQTGYFVSMQDESGTGIGQGWAFRITAREVGDNIQWGSFNKQTPTSPESERETVITEGILNAKLYVRMFNSVREKVCGDSGFFPEP